MGGGANFDIGNASASATYNITGVDAGNVSGSNFTGFGNISGGSGNDTFYFSNSGEVDNIDGEGGTNTLNISGRTSGTIDLAAQTSTNISGNYANITELVGGGANFDIGNASASATYNITGVDAGNVSGSNFTGFGKLSI